MTRPRKSEFAEQMGTSSSHSWVVDYGSSAVRNVSSNSYPTVSNLRGIEGTKGYGREPLCCIPSSDSDGAQ